MEKDKIFTKERIIYGIVISIIGLFGTIVTARSAADSTLTEFRVKTTEELGTVKGNVQVLSSQYTDINRRLEGIEGSLKSISSVILK